MDPLVSWIQPIRVWPNKRQSVKMSLISQTRLASDVLPSPDSTGVAVLPPLRAYFIRTACAQPFSLAVTPLRTSSRCCRPQHLQLNDPSGFILYYILTV